MDKRSSEQRFRKSATPLPLLCENTGALATVEPGFMAGQQSGRPLGRRICGKVRKFKFCIFDF